MSDVGSDPTAAQVHDALERLFAAPPFANAARQRQFLRYVVDEALAGRGSQLKEWSIARHALGEDRSYDPRTDPIVRVLAGRVRISLTRYYEAAGRRSRSASRSPRAATSPGSPRWRSMRPDRPRTSPLRPRV